MREIRQSGSEGGGGETNRLSLPLLPRVSAVSLMAATIFFFLPVLVSVESIPARARAHAQTSVPAQVRKSFALKPSPITSLM